MDQSGPGLSAFGEMRREVRRWLAEHTPEGPVCVAVSGGADSLALAAAVAAERRGTRALIVDHRLQTGSAEVARDAAVAAESVGCVHADVLTVDVSGGGGPEAAARRARYAALEAARKGAPVLVAHTLDDQAETVLLGLARGPGRAPSAACPPTTLHGGARCSGCAARAPGRPAPT